MTDAKRDMLKSRIDQSQARDETRREYSLMEQIEDRALEAKDKFVDFAKEHPIATVAGGVAVGILIASMFKGPRHAAKAGGARAAGLAAIGSEIALGFASQLLDGAQEAGRKGVRGLDHLGDTLGHTAQDLRKGAAHRASDVADAAQSARQTISERINRALDRG